MNRRVFVMYFIPNVVFKRRRAGPECDYLLTALTL